MLPAPVVDPSTAAYTAGRAASVGAEAAEAEACGLGPLGLVTPCLGGLEIRPADREARNSHRLASQGLSYLLDLESPAREAWAPRPAAGGS